MCVQVSCLQSGCYSGAPLAGRTYNRGCHGENTTTRYPSYRYIRLDDIMRDLFTDFVHLGMYYTYHIFKLLLRILFTAQVVVIGRKNGGCQSLLLGQSKSHILHRTMVLKEEPGYTGSLSRLTPLAPSMPDDYERESISRRAQFQHKTTC